MGQRIQLPKVYIYLQSGIQEYREEASNRFEKTNQAYPANLNVQVRAGQSILTASRVVFSVQT